MFEGRKVIPIFHRRSECYSIGKRIEHFTRSPLRWVGTNYDRSVTVSPVDQSCVHLMVWALSAKFAGDPQPCYSASAFQVTRMVFASVPHRVPVPSAICSAYKHRTQSYARLILECRDLHGQLSQRAKKRVKTWAEGNTGRVPVDPGGPTRDLLSLLAVPTFHRVCQPTAPSPVVPVPACQPS